VTHAAPKGEVVETICSRIGDTQADLIVMTSHGRTGLSRAWLGSVADGIVHHATIPVLMLRPIEGKARLLAAHHLFKRILVPLDGSAPSAEVLSAAASLARCSKAIVSLLRVVQPVPLISLDAGVPYASMAAIVDDPATKLLVNDAEEQLGDVARQLREQTGVDVDAHAILEPRVASAILDFARAHDADVIAMSTHGRGLSRFLLGSIADKVLRGSGTPVLIYHPVANPPM
jgi:nucleotide-binding universal stress UspA family protein